MARTPIDPKIKHIRGTNKKSREKKSTSDVVAWDSPIELSEEEQRRFDRYKDYFIEKKAFKSIHSTALAVVVRQETIMGLASNKIQSEDDLIQKFANGVTQISPQLAAFNKALTGFGQLSGEFGLTPKSSQTIAALNDGQMAIDFPDQKIPLRQAR